MARYTREHLEVRVLTMAEVGRLTHTLSSPLSLPPSLSLSEQEEKCKEVYGLSSLK